MYLSRHVDAVGAAPAMKALETRLGYPSTNIGSTLAGSLT